MSKMSSTRIRLLAIGLLAVAAARLAGSLGQQQQQQSQLGQHRHQQQIKRPREERASDEPISEARQLYCRECRSSCDSLLLARAHDEPTGRRRPVEVAPESGFKEQNDANVSLRCHCESIYDSRQRKFKCKNMSLAEAKLKQSTNTNDDSKQRNGDKDDDKDALDAGAVARSQVIHNLW